MGNYEKQACPLCTRDAEYCYVDAGNRKYFNCSECGYFQVSRRAEELLSEKPESYKQDLSAKAKKASEGHLLTILMPGAKDRDANPNISLVAKIITKSELPL